MVAISLNAIIWMVALIWLVAFVAGSWFDSWKLKAERKERQRLEGLCEAKSASITSLYAELADLHLLVNEFRERELQQAKRLSEARKKAWVTRRAA